MLVEIPDPQVIFGVIVAFLVGLSVFYGYYKIRPYINLKKVEADPDQQERLEYYERQLIDMKIRLDALELEGPGEKASIGRPEMEVRTKPAVEELQEAESSEEARPPQARQAQRLPNMAVNNAVDYVLHLITDKSMTSRDIQVTLGRSREHTSRLMKKLFEEGYVHRNVDAKPYTYSITEKGKERLVLEGPPAPP